MRKMCVVRAPLTSNRNEPSHKSSETCHSGRRSLSLTYLQIQCGRRHYILGFQGPRSMRLVLGQRRAVGDLPWPPRSPLEFRREPLEYSPRDRRRRQHDETVGGQKWQTAKDMGVCYQHKTRGILARRKATAGCDREAIRASGNDSRLRDQPRRGGGADG